MQSSQYEQIATPVGAPEQGAAPVEPAAGVPGASSTGPAAGAIERPPPAAAAHPTPSTLLAAIPREIGGRDGPEPTRFGDWEKAGRCIDF